jgi:hypothetical protein
VRRTLTVLLSVVVAFLAGVSLVGMASGHSGFGRLLHSGHSDRIRGALTAKAFRFDRAKKSWHGLAAVTIRPIEPDDPNCTGVAWNIPEEQDFRTQPTYVTSPPDCWMGGQVMLPDKANITAMTMHIYALTSPSPVEPVDITFQLVAFEAFGAGSIVDEETFLKIPGDPSEPSSCSNACVLAEGVDPKAGLNPVINQRRTYILRYRTTSDVPLNATRLLVTYTVRTPGPG